MSQPSSIGFRLNHNLYYSRYSIKYINGTRIPRIQNTNSENTRRRTRRNLTISVQHLSHGHRLKHLIQSLSLKVNMHEDHNWFKTVVLNSDKIRFWKNTSALIGHVWKALTPIILTTTDDVILYMLLCNDRSTSLHKLNSQMHASYLSSSVFKAFLTTLSNCASCNQSHFSSNWNLYIRSRGGWTRSEKDDG